MFTTAVTIYIYIGIKTGGLECSIHAIEVNNKRWRYMILLVELHSS